MNAPTVVPVSGMVVWLDRKASVQFAARKPTMFRITRVLAWNPPPGWVWLSGYQLGADGLAVELRELMLRLDGLRQAYETAAEPAPKVPAQRRSLAGAGVRR